MANVEILTQKGHDFLWINDRLWMWGLPEEIEDQKEIAENASGKVLVAGYGLGIVQKFLLENRQVDFVLTVEASKEVLDVCKSRYGKLYGDIVLCDYYDFESQIEFDTVVGDIWENVNERYLEEYERFRVKANELLSHKGKVLSWGGDYFEYLRKRPKYYD